MNCTKDLSPQQTIQNARNILRQLNILTVESINCPDNVKFYSYRVEIINEGLEDLHIGTNGKGMTPEYALASAYGEFLERLQNQTLLTGVENMVVSAEEIGRNWNVDLPKFVYAPDERNISLQQAIEMSGDVMAKFLKCSDQDEVESILKQNLKSEELLMIPFFNVNRDGLQYLPISLLSAYVGSNGMCAGNTPEEAMVQGILEVIERYVLKRIFIEELTPPDIPLEYFKDTEIYQRIEELEKSSQYKVVVKDCSLGQDWPVIGVIIVDQQDLTYMFKLGADPDPTIALERCLTEIFQGGSLNMTAPLTFYDEPFENTEEKVRNYYDVLVDGMGAWPLSLFDKTESYAFAGLTVNNNQDNRYRLNQLLEQLTAAGFDVFLRDQSILGFPAYLVYIPEMSETNYVFTEPPKALGIISDFSRISLLYRLKELSSDQFAELAQSVEAIDNCELVERFDPQNYWLYNLSEELKELMPELFLTMLNYRLGNYAKGVEAMDSFLQTIRDEEREEYSYYFVVRDFLKMKNHGLGEVEIQKELEFYHGEEAQEIISDFEQPSEIFQYFPLPSCFDCKSCEVAGDCRYFQAMQIVGRLQKRAVDAEIDQNGFKKILTECMFSKSLIDA
ncbi:MAG: YcaO-like family protein [Marinifilaceae bacterium]